VFCRAHAVQLHRAREDFDAAGVRLAVIGQGTPRHAQHFVDEYDLDGMQVLVDPERQTYKAAGAKVATVDELWNPKVVARGTKVSAKERVVQGRTDGHAAQLGGTLVVAPGGEIAYAHMSDDASDNAPVEEILTAARAAADK
jgi:peroxiredoxin